MSKPKIAVLGAGPMGLAAAYQLVKDGYEPVVFEADDRVGGMAAAFDFGGLSIERYYHFHCTSDHDFFKVLEELGIQDKLHWVATKMGFFHKGEVHPWGNPIALLRFPHLSFSAAFRYGLHAFLCTKRRDWRPLDKLDAIRWLKKWVGEEAYNILWSKLFEYKFYDYATNLSAAWIWSRISRVGRSRSSVFSEKLGYLDGGSETLLHAMKAYIEEHGGEIRLSSPVSRVVIEDAAVKAIEFDGGLEKFDKVISTIPLPYIPGLIPDLPKDILKRFLEVKNIAVVCVIVKLKNPLTDKFWLNVNDPEMDIPGVIEYTNLRPLDNHIVYVPFYMPGDHPKFSDENQVFLDKVKKYISTINPDIGEADYLDIRASRYRYAQPICEPGHLDTLPAPNVLNGLWLADTSYYYPEDRGISESTAFGRTLAKEATA